MKYKIVGDSSCDLSKEMEKKYNIAIAPLSFSIDGEEFIDDENLDLAAYLKKINDSPSVPKSSCPSIQDYLDRFEGDHEWTFGVTISSELSGSYNSAMNAQKMFLEKNENKKVHIFNSRGASSMEVLIVIKIIELVEANMEFEEIVDKVEAFIKESKILFVLDNIDTLEKNGRLSSMKAKIVRALNLKLILTTTDEGAIDMFDKSRGFKKTLRKMVKSVGLIGKEPKGRIFAIAHCNAPERAQYVKELVTEMYDYKEVIILETRGLSSTYTNVGGIITAF
jgi:DegV family protein with EDD domain